MYELTIPLLLYLLICVHLNKNPAVHILFMLVHSALTNVNKYNS